MAREHANLAEVPTPTDQPTFDHLNKLDRVYVVTFALAADGKRRRFSQLEDAVDRVRWDALVATGKWQGSYEDHATSAEKTDRAAARAVIKADFNRPCAALGGRSYGNLVMEKIFERTLAAIPDKEESTAPAAGSASEPV